MERLVSSKKIKLTIEINDDTFKKEWLNQGLPQTQEYSSPYLIFSTIIYTCMKAFFSGGQDTGDLPLFNAIFYAHR